jgi:hypothetical protein
MSCALGLLLLLAACGPALEVRGNQVTVGPTLGGSIDTFSRTIGEQWDCQVRIEGDQASAGTFWLGHRDICVTEGVRFGFHAPSVWYVPEGWTREQGYQALIAHMEAIYRLRSDTLADWFVQTCGAPHDSQVRWFTVPELESRFGFTLPRCED